MAGERALETCMMSELQLSVKQDILSVKTAFEINLFEIDLTCCRYILAMEIQSVQYEMNKSDIMK